MKSTLEVRIRVRGRLSERLAAAFDGMALVRCTGTTELVGEVVDQAQLHGLLTRIRDLGLALESVSVVGTDPARSMEASRLRPLAQRDLAPPPAPVPPTTPNPGT